MATVVLCPQFGNGYQAFTAGGVPLNGGLLNTYLAGSSTPAATYTTSLGNTQHANPIQLNSDGRPPGGEVWLLQGQAYKFVLTDSTGANSLTWDNITGINDAAALIGTITAAVLPVIPVVLGGTGQTTTNAALDALHTSQAFVTSAGTLNLNAVSSSYVQVLGNTSITAVTLNDGWERTLLFNSAVAISSNSTLLLPGRTTITTAPGDTAIVRGESVSVARVVMFQRAAASATVTQIAVSLTGNVALNNTGTYFDGPSVTQGTVGTWFASGTVALNDTAGASTMNLKLWDGTTIMASATISSDAANARRSVALSGLITNPAGNIRISVIDPSSTSGVIEFNVSGNSKDSTLTVMRVA